MKAVNQCIFPPIKEKNLGRIFLKFHLLWNMPNKWKLLHFFLNFRIYAYKKRPFRGLFCLQNFRSLFWMKEFFREFCDDWKNSEIVKKKLNYHWFSRNLTFNRQIRLPNANDKNTRNHINVNAFSEKKKNEKYLIFVAWKLLCGYGPKSRLSWLGSSPFSQKMTHFSPLVKPYDGWHVRKTNRHLNWYSQAKIWRLPNTWS